jgi:hypothetical protein
MAPAKHTKKRPGTARGGRSKRALGPSAPGSMDSKSRRLAESQLTRSDIEKLDFRANGDSLAGIGISLVNGGVGRVDSGRTPFPNKQSTESQRGMRSQKTPAEDFLSLSTDMQNRALKLSGNPLLQPAVLKSQTAKETTSSTISFHTSLANVSRRKMNHPTDPIPKKKSHQQQQASRSFDPSLQHQRQQQQQRSLLAERPTPKRHLLRRDSRREADNEKSKGPHMRNKRDSLIDLCDGSDDDTEPSASPEFESSLQQPSMDIGVTTRSKKQKPSPPPPSRSRTPSPHPLQNNGVIDVDYDSSSSSTSRPSNKNSMDSSTGSSRPSIETSGRSTKSLVGSSRPSTDTSGHSTKNSIHSSSGSSSRLSTDTSGQSTKSLLDDLEKDDVFSPSLDTRRFSSKRIIDALEKDHGDCARSSDTSGFSTKSLDGDESFRNVDKVVVQKGIVRSVCDRIRAILPSTDSIWSNDKTSASGSTDVGKLKISKKNKPQSIVPGASLKNKNTTSRSGMREGTFCSMHFHFFLISL